MPIRRTISNPGRPDRWLRFALLVAVLGAGLYGAWQRQIDRPQATDSTVPVAKQQSEAPPIAFDDSEQGTASAANRSQDNPTAGRMTIADQTIRDLNGRIAFRGDVDVGSTIARMGRGEQLEFAHDGMVFQNREKRLPQKPPGYYREYVHPTPGVAGPGPQRIVRGNGGETYYTPDHYGTFRRLDK